MKFTHYLFVYFTGNEIHQEAIHFALSNDGYHFNALNENKPVIDSAKISSTGGVRDPHITRGDKSFYMVATDMVSSLGWESNRGIVLLKSNDLINWTSAIINFQKRFPNNENLLRVWAPQSIYDAEEKKYMIYFSMKHGEEPDKIYYVYANHDFTNLETEPKELFSIPGIACIDGDIILKDNQYHLFFKTHDHENGIQVAVSDRLTGGYILRNGYIQQTNVPVEGSFVYQLIDSDEYILMYDCYMDGKYQFTKTKDLKNYILIDEKIRIDFHPRHGSVLTITTLEAERLQTHWANKSKNQYLKKGI